jgi:uncharacterized protein involved in exopolysaccharide biosynthesis
MSSAFPAPRPGRAFGFDESDGRAGLARLIGVLHECRWWVAASTLLGGAAAMGVAWVSRPVFEAKATLLVIESKVGGQSLYPRRLAEDYRALVLSPENLTPILEELGLGAAPHHLTVSRLQRAVEVEPGGVNSPVLTVTVQLADGELARRAADGLAVGAVALSRKLNDSDLTRSRDYLEVQVHEARGGLARADAELLAFSRGARVDETRASLEHQLKERARLFTDLASARESIAKLTASNQTLARELDREKPVVELMRTLADDPRLLAESGGPAGPAAALGLSLKSEELNPIHSSVKNELVSGLARLAGDLSGVERMETESAEIGNLLIETQKRLAEKERELERLKAERALAQSVLEKLVLEHEDARVRVLSRSEELKLLSPAVRPDRPVWPPGFLLAVAGLLVGFSVGIGVALFRDYLRPGTRAGEQDIVNPRVEETVSVARSTRG